MILIPPLFSKCGLLSIRFDLKPGFFRICFVLKPETCLLFWHLDHCESESGNETWIMLNPVLDIQNLFSDSTFWKTIYLLELSFIDTCMDSFIPLNPAIDIWFSKCKESTESKPGIILTILHVNLDHPESGFWSAIWPSGCKSLEPGPFWIRFKSKNIDCVSFWNLDRTNILKQSNPVISMCDIKKCWVSTTIYDHLDHLATAGACGGFAWAACQVQARPDGRWGVDDWLIFINIYLNIYVYICMSNIAWSRAQCNV